MTDETTSAAEAGNVAATTEAAATTTSATSWRDSLPDDIKASPSISKFETVEGLAKSYTNLERMLGADKVVVPKDGDTEGWDRFYAAAGRPENPDEYGFKQPEQIPEGMVYNAELDTQLAGIMHKGGLNRQQAMAVREGLLEIVGKGALDSLEAAKTAETERLAQVQAGEQALKTEWGQAYEQRGRVAGAAINKFLSPETIAVLESAGVANNPSIVKDMYTLGIKLAGEKDLIGEADLALSPGDLDARIAKFNADNMAALMDQSHPAHATLIKERDALYRKRFG